MSWLMADAVDPAPWIHLEHRAGAAGGRVHAELHGIVSPQSLLDPAVSETLAHHYAEYLHWRVHESRAVPGTLAVAAPLLRNALARALRRCVPEGTRAAAVYVADSAAPRRAEAWASFVRALLDRTGTLRRKVEVVALPAEARPGFLPASLPARLPMRVLCPEPLRQRWLAQASYLRDEGVREWMIDVRPDSDGETDDFTLVRVVDADAASEAFASAQVRPALWIVLDTTPRQPFRPDGAARPGTAVAVLPCLDGADPARVLRDYFLEVVHDRPLHECMTLMRSPVPGPQRPAPEWWQLPRLYADPTSNQALRLSRAADEIEGQARAAFVASQVVRHASASRLPRSPRAAAKSTTPGAPAAAASFVQATATPIDFAYERRGLIPLARAAAATAAVLAASERLVARAGTRLASEAARRAAERRQKRCVDLQLARRRGRRAVGAIDPGGMVDPGAPLRLRLHVGLPHVHSLLAVAPPSVDELLPPLAGAASHDLVVTLVPQDFRLESDATQRLALPRFGPSPPIEWDLSAPRVLRRARREPGVALATAGRGWCSEDVATMRVNLHFRNQLLQSFRLTATQEPIGSAVVWRIGQAVCDFSTTRAFAHLDQVAERLISLAVNRNPSGTHTLMVNNDGNAQAVHWKETALARAAGDIRRQLLQAMESSAGQPRFLLDVKTLMLQSNDDLASEDSLRALAEAGSALWNKLFNIPGGEPLRRLLDTVRSGAGLPIQIQLLDPDYALPWQVMYDYPVPTKAAERARPVCRGQANDRSPCQCVSAGDRYCIRGFWGMRHVIEQLVDAPATSEESPPVLGRRSLGVGLFQGFDSAYFKDWPQGLAKDASVAVSVRDADAELLGQLADSPSRPPVVLVVAHHENQGSDDLPRPHVLARSAAAGSILSEGSFSRAGVLPWPPPRTLVLLLACGSGQTRVDTGASLASLLLRHGAIGVVCTECTVYASLIARFARDFLKKFAAGRPVGEAVREINHELAVEGCPLGLVYSYLGRTQVTWS